MRQTNHPPGFKSRLVFATLTTGLWLIAAAAAAAWIRGTGPGVEERSVAAAAPGESAQPQVPVSPKGMKAFTPKPPPIFWKVCPEPFGFNSSALTMGQIELLKNAGEMLKNDNANWVVIEGHRDSSERAGLSQERANQARDFLVGEMGIDAARIILRNLCAQCPAKDDQMNRRIEIGIVPREPVLPSNFSLNADILCPVSVRPCREMPVMEKRMEINRRP